MATLINSKKTIFNATKHNAEVRIRNTYDDAIKLAKYYLSINNDYNAYNEAISNAKEDRKQAKKLLRTQFN